MFLNVFISCAISSLVTSLDAQADTKSIPLNQTSLDTETESLLEEVGVDDPGLEDVGCAIINVKSKKSKREKKKKRWGN